MELQYSFRGAEHGAKVVLVDTTQATVWTVTSGRKAKLRSLIITNHSNAANVLIGDVSCDTANTWLNLRIPASDTVVFNKDDLYGLEFLSTIVAKTDISGTFIYMGIEEY